MANVKPEQRIQSLCENIDIANRLGLRQPVKLRRNVAPTQGSRDGERRIGPIELTERQQRASQCRGCRWFNRRGSHRSLRLDQSRTRIIRSEEHTSELQSVMRISYAVFCLKKKKYIKVTSYCRTIA